MGKGAYCAGLTEELGTDPEHTCKHLGIATCVPCNPSTDQAKTGGPLRLAGFWKPYTVLLQGEKPYV